MQAEIRHLQGLTFVATADTGHAVVMDTAPKSGGSDSGTTPKELVLDALGGCTGMDVISILSKMRLQPASFSVVARADVSEEPPRAFSRIDLEYRFETLPGAPLPLASLERAVSLSQDKYCSVSHMLRKACPIEWKITVDGQEMKRSIVGAALAED